LSVAVQERYFETPEALRTFEGQTLTVGKLLGWATGPEQVYTMQQQVGLGINGYVKLLSLPDEDIALLLLGSDIQDNGGPDWHIIKP
jgi:hypothetical protein